MESTSTRDVGAVSQLARHPHEAFLRFVFKGSEFILDSLYLSLFGPTTLVSPGSFSRES